MNEQEIRDMLVEPYPEIYKFGQNCTSGREALEELKFQIGNITYYSHDLQATSFRVKDVGLYERIEHDLEEYEIAKDLIHELRIILYGDDEECKTDFDIIRKCQLKIFNYLEDRAKRFKFEQLKGGM